VEEARGRAPAVAVVTRFYPPYGDRGGAETQAQRIGRYLAARSDGAELITTRFRRDLPRLADDGGLVVRRLPTARQPLAQIVEFAVGFAWFVRHGGRFRIVQAFCLSAFSLGCVLGARLRGARTIVLPCSVGERGDIAKVLRRPGGALLWRLFRTADVIGARTSGTADELTAHGIPAERMGRLPGLLDPSYDDAVALDDRSTARRALGLPDRPTVLYVGRLVEAKGIGTILDAWSGLGPRLDATLVVVGDGPLRERVSDAVATAPPGSIVFAGRRDDPAPYYRAADVFLYPSRSEAYGGAMAEAMAMGLPLVVTRTGLAADYVRDGEEGLIVPADDPRRLGAAIESLLADGPRRHRMGEKALQMARETFSPNRAGQLHVDLYRRLLDGEAPGQQG
jgi:glycosyltransferase involved in cell wall biosynthesis